MVSPLQVPEQDPTDQVKVLPDGLQDPPDEIDVVEAGESNQEEVEGVAHVCKEVRHGSEEFEEPNPMFRELFLLVLCK